MADTSVPQRMQILFVDDEVNILNSIRRLFMDECYDVHTAASGREALDQLGRRKDFAVIVSDQRMPEMAGAEFLAKARAIAPDAVRIVLTGHADVNAAVDAINRGGAYRYIAKPWNDGELRMTIANAVEYYQLSKRNEYLSQELVERNHEMSKLNSALEWVLSEKTAELMLHNRTAAFSRNILQALPSGVLCVNSDDVIILCNDACRQLLMSAAMSLVGRDRRGSLPAELNGFIDIVRERKEHGVSLIMNSRNIGALGKCVAFAENEDGIVVVLGEKDIMDRAAI